jgi:hypothetical protein
MLEASRSRPCRNPPPYPRFSISAPAPRPAWPREHRLVGVPAAAPIEDPLWLRGYRRERFASIDGDIVVHDLKKGIAADDDLGFECALARLETEFETQPASVR